MQSFIDTIKDTIDINRDILENSVEDTNDLLVIDMLDLLGYNRRTNRNITKLRNSALHWVISTKTEGSDEKFVIYVKVVALGSELTGVTVEEFMQSNIEKEDGLLVTDGQRIAIFTDNDTINPFKIIDTFDNGEETDEIIHSISASGDIIKYINSAKKIPFDKFIQTITNVSEVFNQSFIDNLKGQCGETEDSINKLLDMLKGNNLGSTSDTAVISDNTDELTKEFEEEINGLREEINRLNESKAETDNDILKKDEELKNIESQLQIANEQIQSLIKQLSDSTEQLQSANKQIQVLEEQLAEANGKIQAANEQAAQSDSSEQNTNNAELINSYISQIEELHNELSNLREELEAKEEEVARLNNIINNPISQEDINSRELLDTIVDNPDEPKSYVGVVNGNLFQAATKERFAGLALQELYSIVRFDLMDYIFDGDTFKITDDTVRGDLMLNNKVYDIDLSDLSDEDIMAKLNHIFEKFPSVVFHSKIVGREISPDEYSEKTDETSEDAISDFGEEENNFAWAEDSSNETDLDTPKLDITELDVDKLEVTEFNKDLVEDLDIQDFQGTEDEDTQYIADDTTVFADNDTAFVEDTDESGSAVEPVSKTVEEELTNTNKVYGFAISDLDQVMWDEEFHITKLIYISGDYQTYKIIGDNAKEQIISIFNAISMLSNNIPIAISEISKFNFSSVSKLVSNDSENDDSAIKIPYTNQYLKCLDVKYVVGLFQQVCTLSGVDPTSVFMYLEAEDDNNTYANNIVDISDWNLDESSKLDVTSDVEETVNCIISGTIQDQVFMNDATYQAIKNLVKECIAIRTHLLKHQIMIDDIQNEAKYLFTEILANADIPIEQVVSMVGTLPISGKQLISTEARDIHGERTVLQLNGDNYYIAKLEPWELLIALIRLQTLSMDDKAISVRVILNKTALDFYSQSFYTTDPNTDAAIRSLTSYILTRLK